jgi:hypothetical protein
VQAIGSLITGLQSRQPAHGSIKRSAALQGRATVLEPQNSRDLLLVSACFILPFLSRMILAPLWRGFPFWQVEPIGAPPNCFDAEERESLPRMSLDL